MWNWRDSQQTIKYEFDAFFDKEASQKQVYESCVKPLLLHTLNGQNASVFAYGPTGAGKIEGLDLQNEHFVTCRPIIIVKGYCKSALL